MLAALLRIVTEKRSDRYLFLVTDGITWKNRSNDLRKLIRLQNEGGLAKIYMKAMAREFERDLKSLKEEFGL